MTNGCGIDTTLYRILVVSDKVAIDRINLYNLLDSICPGDTAMVIIEGNYFKNFKWNFGDGLTSSETYNLTFNVDNGDNVIFLGKHVYNRSGQFKIKLEYSNYCGAVGEDSVDIIIKNNLAVDRENYQIPYLDYPHTICKPIRFFGFGGKSYVWDFGDGTSPINTNQSLVSHSYSQKGEYEASVTITNSCGNSGTITGPISVADGCLLGLMSVEKDNNKVSVFPNPVSDVSTVSFATPLVTSIKMYLVDPLGTKTTVRYNTENDATQLTFSVKGLNLPDGIYMLCIEKEGKIISEKISIIK
ncbi:MAG TPA: PKD domain-containing protein [Cytophagaceae bacterium]|jgi:PKD repeat protein